MAEWDDVRRIALSLPETDEHASYGGAPAWRVKGKSFVWDRPLGAADLDELGDDAATGPVLGARVADEGEKRALIAENPTVFFTVSHFDGYAAVLLRLDAVSPTLLREVVVEAWLVRAPVRLRREHEETLVRSLASGRTREPPPPE
ncbi:MmcQ/YjbR family DNA-binding protein [Rhodococcoides corynebacterioides]|uniref:MmcQ/YjbR family DNA-binding protein n=1 Tax=Rhodococcoides corynebacterioides TaxID=53972 RepID=UPI003AE4398D